MIQVLIIHGAAFFNRCCASLCAVLLCLFLPLAPTQADTQTPLVMSPYTWEPHNDIRGWWMSEKYDGIRGYWTGSQLVSRVGNVFVVPPWFTENFPTEPLDGELWVGRQTFAELSSIVLDQTPDETAWKRVHYMIFDAPQARGGFEARLDFARQWFDRHPNTYVKIVDHEICKDAEHLQQKLADIEGQGGEGLILRRPLSPYMVGRSRDILKVKTFQDDDAVVMGYRPGKGRHDGRVGALWVELPNGVQFAIGTGLTDAERDNPPPLGSTITFKYHGFTKDGKPRSASFLRVREDLRRRVQTD
jgi:DNA ligase-1